MVIHPRIQCVDPASNHLPVKNNDSAHKHTLVCMYGNIHLYISRVKVIIMDNLPVV